MPRDAHQQPSFRRLKAHAISSDGERREIIADAVYIEVDDERGLLIDLNERMPGEGVAIRSLPQPEPNSGSASPGEAKGSTTDPQRGSILVMRGAGANLLYVSPTIYSPNRVEPHLG
ncbi:MAG: hypothetical protein VKP70_08955 [Cyanobacteriota bacterium]|nr:hypothetical protein [Cyanobacteriota bacterium]